MVSEQRQRAMETNRSLRNIKNELESLLEKGVITESDFDTIQSLLPTEASLSAPAPPRRSQQTSPAAPASPSVAGLANLSLQPNPPSYAASTGAAPPALPARNRQGAATPTPPPPPPPGKPVIAHARAVYRYAASDARDCSFERDDKVEVYEYMNADWWMGRNLRTGAEGIFPKNYVEKTDWAPTPALPTRNNNGYAGGPNNDEKVLWPPQPAGGYNGGYAPPPQPTYGGYPPPPGPANPYNAYAPPMAVANQGQQPPPQQQQEGEGSGANKFSEGGKKIGKKLGNAAIFGAGATIGSNIVNSIF